MFFQSCGSKLLQKKIKVIFVFYFIFLQVNFEIFFGKNSLTPSLPPVCISEREAICIEQKQKQKTSFFSKDESQEWEFFLMFIEFRPKISMKLNFVQDWTQVDYLFTNLF